MALAVMQGIPHIYHPNTYGRQVLGRSYVHKLLDVQPKALVAYWPYLDPGQDRFADLGPYGYHNSYLAGTRNQGGIEDGKPSALAPGNGAIAGLLATGLATAYPRNEGTLMAWAKVESAATWTNGQYGTVVTMGYSGSELTSIVKLNSNNTMALVRGAPGAFKLITKGGITTTGWMCILMTWSLTADVLTGYFNGAVFGTPQTNINEWVNQPVADRCALGNGRVAVQDAPWRGWIAHVAVWSVPLSAAQAAYLAVL